MRDVIKVGERQVTVQKLRKPRWPDGAWQCFCGNLEASGSTRESAIYNFERAASALPSHNQGAPHE